jgi:urease accessory protein
MAPYFDPRSGDDTAPSAPTRRSVRGGLAGLLFLADGRLPVGGHAHGGGVEPAAADGRIHDASSLSDYLTGRLATTGRVDAALAVTSSIWADGGAQPSDAILLEAEASARIASPALRVASRAQGRGLLRVARRAWSDPVFDVIASVHAAGPLWPIALGVSAWSAAGPAPMPAPPGSDGPREDRSWLHGVATLALWAAVSGPAWAAVRLLGLDPIEVAARLADLAPVVDAEAGTAAAWGRRREPMSDWVAELPAVGAPLTEIAAEAHGAWEVRLFAS